MSDAQDLLTSADIRAADKYEVERADELRHQVDVKRHRRINLDHRISLVFENRETVRGAVEEVVRAERISGAGQIEAEVAAFNQIVPRPGELSACLFLEISDPAHLSDASAEFAGVGDAVTIRVGGETISASAHLVDTELGPPAVYHLRFALTDAQRKAWINKAEVMVAVDHPACKASATLGEAEREALAQDLR